MVNLIETLRVTVITANWNYRSQFSAGSDHGTKICIYSAEREKAVYIKTRDRMIGAQNGKWKPRNAEDHYYDERKRDIFERREISANSGVDALVQSLPVEDGFDDLKVRQMIIRKVDFESLLNLDVPNKSVYLILEKYLNAEK